MGNEDLNNLGDLLWTHKLRKFGAILLSNCLELIASNCPFFSYFTPQKITFGRVILSAPFSVCFNASLFLSFVFSLLVAALVEWWLMSHVAVDWKQCMFLYSRRPYPQKYIHFFLLLKTNKQKFYVEKLYFMWACAEVSYHWCFRSILVTGVLSLLL